MSFAQAFGSKPFAVYPLVVGGVGCTAWDTACALDVLLAAPGGMIRQPLARAGCLLAACDYHAVAAPYRALFAATPSPGRGAAGRQIAKQAFCWGLEQVLEQAALLAPAGAWAAVTRRAWAAFGADFGYGEAIARAAVALLAPDGAGVSARLAGALRVRDGDGAGGAELAGPVRVGQALAVSAA